MFPNERPALCVAIHDVAPATWPERLHLLHALEAVADIPISWLVAPRYHNSAQRSPACEATPERLIGQGHEVVLHGYTHLDTAPPGGSLRGRFFTHHLYRARGRVFGPRRRRATYQYGPHAPPRPQRER